jgi:chromosome partitioning protein
MAEVSTSDVQAAPAGGSGPHIIVIGNEKGGAGKSTVAMHLAAALVRAGRRVSCLDLDLRQRTLNRYIENRLAWGDRQRKFLPTPTVLPIAASAARDLNVAEAEDAARLAGALAAGGGPGDYVIIDAPGADTHLSRLAHAEADTLISPINDSFVDFDLLGDVDPETFEVRRPSVYAELVWESRKRKAQRSRRPIDWVVMRNRLNTGKIDSKNSQRIAEALRALAPRVGFRVAPGLSERVIYRELFPKGLTLLDLDEAEGRALTMSHIAARQELRDMLIVMKAPGLDGAPLGF